MSDTFYSQNPYNLDIIAEHTFMDDSALDKALVLSAQHYASWRKKGPRYRVGFLNKLAQKLQAYETELARLITQEMGKPIIQAKMEVKKCRQLCTYYAQNGEAFMKDQLRQTNKQTCQLSLQPIGTILGIMPWNFPLWQVFRFAVPNLLLGNTVLLKHAPNTTLCSLKINELFLEAGFTEGSFQSILCDNDQTHRLIAAKEIQGVAFTGSTTTGSAIATTAGKNLKRNVLELGGNDAALIMESADPQRAIEQSLKSRFLNSGQSCIATKRILIHEKHWNFSHECIAQILSEYKLGDPTLYSTDIGPLARKDLRDYAQQAHKLLVTKGQEIFNRTVPENNNGYFCPISVVDITGAHNSFLDTEVFAPILQIQKVSSDQEAIKIANETSYGLGASLYIDPDHPKKIDYAKSLEVGSCAINSMVKSQVEIPFGGTKKSGYGRELGPESLVEFANLLSIT